jgi:hypothetical protein
MTKTLLLAGLALAGCATTNRYERMLQSWVGASADDLIETWGPPSAAAPLGDGGRILEWSWLGGTVVYAQRLGYGTLATGSQAWCQTSFRVDERNRVIRWSWRGNSCRR